MTLGPSEHGVRFERSVPAVPAEVSDLRSAVVDFGVAAGAGPDVAAAVRIAVSEALTNAVVHAYAGRAAPGPMAVEAWCDDKSLFVTVSDEGDGMRPRPDSPGLGLGLPLLAQMADDFRVEDRPNLAGTRVSMRFSLDGSGTGLA